MVTICVGLARILREKVKWNIDCEMKEEREAHEMNEWG